MSNRRLLMIFLLVLGIFVSFKLVPLAREWQQSLDSDIDRLQGRQEQLERLLEKQDEWKTRLDRMKLVAKSIESSSLPAGRPEVASARLQSMLRGFADASQVEISSLSLPETETWGEWNLLYEVVTMRGSESQILGFLDQVESGNKRLRVVGFQMRKDRRNLFGEATVVGFAPIAPVLEAPGNE